MDMPTPSPEHQRLSAFTGEWEGKETLPPSPYAPEGGPAEGRWLIRGAVGGFFFIGDYQQARDGSVNLEGHAVLGYDGDQYFMYWFDSSGFVASVPPRGSWQGDALVLEHELAGMGHARYTLT